MRVAEITTRIVRLERNKDASLVLDIIDT